MHSGESQNSPKVPYRSAQMSWEGLSVQLHVLHPFFNRIIPCISTFMFHIFEFIMRFLFEKKNTSCHLKTVKALCSVLGLFMKEMNREMGIYR